MKTSRMIGATAAAALLAVGAGGPVDGADRADASARVNGPDAAARSDGEGQRLRAEGRFAPPDGTGVPRAVTYDRRLVPEGARITVEQRVDGAGTRVAVAVRGVLPGHTYGVHVHTAPCGADPDDAGPHYQHRPDPVRPSTDPAYANPGNEIWLDLTAGPGGDGRAATLHPWNFRTGEARSVVLHEHATRTAPGEAGMAGGRVGCFTVPLLGGGGDGSGGGGGAGS
ncbi:superoxide dismutase family protein [Streptomyces sp. NPDC054784]